MSEEINKMLDEIRSDHPRTYSRLMIEAGREYNNSDMKEEYWSYVNRVVVEKFSVLAEPPKRCQGNMQLGNIHWEGEPDE